ncbi:N-formylglutamate amidohydrolase [Breoghania sp.]|uniref:N-formylglutamate amidohydrolase n=1 Tax=Breoghania sp. TaxID=2065378 RepID=UPI002637DB1E|nr:N-formylglutamate amidohydrolase [Breoghania sp.]MDJ0933585.1 N-formylglutamate amidohydrolase [Breoghania sp.]
MSDGIRIPGNEGFSRQQIEARRTEILEPYQKKIAYTRDARRAASQPTLFFSMHSCTPVFGNQPPRPWHIGIMSDGDWRIGDALIEFLEKETNFCIGRNQSYEINTATDYTIPVHAIGRSLPYVEIEIHQDLIGDEAGQQAWADLLTDIFPDGSTAKNTAPAVRSLREQVRQKLPDFTDAERRVAQTLLADYPVAGLETIARFAKRAGTSGPTILRFVSQLGFQTYADFQNALHEEIHIRLQGPLTHYPSASHPEKTDLTEQVSETMRANIATVSQALAQEDLREITALLSDVDRTAFFLGGRFSHILATYFHHYMRELHPKVRLVRDTSAT